MSTTAPGTSFKRRAVQVTSGAASAGVLIALSLVGAAPASADPTCDVTDTVDATGTGTQADIQTLLAANASTICLVGTFNLTATLAVTADVTIFGLTDAELHGAGALPILVDATNGHEVTIQNLTVSNGFTGAPGGAGGVSAGSVIAIDSHFTGNTGVFGGAIAAQTVHSTNSVFDHNSAAQFGAAIISSSSVIDGSTFTDNAAGSGGEDGAGAVAAFSDVAITSSTFTRNTSDYGAGAVLTYGLATVTASTFDDNSSAVFSGAIDAASVDIENSTFVINSVGETGGAISVGYGVVLQSTFLDNTAGDDGGQSIFQGNTSSPLNLRGNIFASDSAAPQLGASEGSTIVDLGGNIFSTAAADETALTSVQASTSFGISPAVLFATSALANNGGPTQTVALSATSPAIDHVPAGEPSVAVDQRGVARTALSDSGAYEQGVAAQVLAATGLVPNGWLGGAAALLLAVGVGVVGFGRRMTRTH